MEERKPPRLDPSLERHGYKWMPITPEEVGKDIREALMKNSASCFVMDVYATNNRVYRNIVCEFEEHPGTESSLNMRFDRDSGKGLVIEKVIE